MDLAEFLPESLRRADLQVRPISAGMSGAGVYRVDTAGETFLLKVASVDIPVAGWRAALELQRSAAGSGVAPRVLHVDEARRAVVSDFVTDRSFPMLYGTPETRGEAIALLARTVRTLHALPRPAALPARDGVAFLAEIWSTLPPGFVPAFAAELVADVLARGAPDTGCAPVVSHNDLNPGNIAYDGERLLLLDWDTAGVNDPMHDLATTAVFMRMDPATCRQLLGEYRGHPVEWLPAGFVDTRRLVATMCGTNFLSLARRAGHPAASAADTRETALTLAEFYTRLRTGELQLTGAEGQWQFGLALLASAADPAWDATSRYSPS